MKNILKKNQIIVFTIALMLIVAGYMNYTINTEESLETASLTDTEKYGEIGDATLVSSNIINEKETELTEGLVNNENIINENTVETSKNDILKTNSYFEESRLEREKMYSQMIESYQKILDNTQLSETQKQIAQTEIKTINNTKNAIMISENLIKNKGFQDVVIFVNDNSVNIIIKSEELVQEQIAQIQNIIQRELKAEIDAIHISNKE